MNIDSNSYFCEYRLVASIGAGTYLNELFTSVNLIWENKYPAKIGHEVVVIQMQFDKKQNNERLTSSMTGHTCVYL